MEDEIRCGTLDAVQDDFATEQRRPQWGSFTDSSARIEQVGGRLRLSLGTAAEARGASYTAIGNAIVSPPAGALTVEVVDVEVALGSAVFIQVTNVGKLAGFGISGEIIEAVVFNGSGARHRRESSAARCSGPSLAANSL